MKEYKPCPGTQQLPMGMPELRLNDTLAVILFCVHPKEDLAYYLLIRRRKMGRRKNAEPVAAVSAKCQSRLVEAQRLKFRKGHVRRAPESQPGNTYRDMLLAVATTGAQFQPKRYPIWHKMARVCRKVLKRRCEAFPAAAFCLMFPARKQPAVYTAKARR